MGASSASLNIEKLFPSSSSSAVMMSHLSFLLSLFALLLGEVEDGRLDTPHLLHLPVRFGQLLLLLLQGLLHVRVQLAQGHAVPLGRLQLAGGALPPLGLLLELALLLLELLLALLQERG